MGWGKSRFNCLGFKGPALVLFLFYVNVYGMRPWSRLSSQPLTILAPWVFLCIGCSISLGPPCVTTSHFLVDNRETELKPNIFSSVLLFFVFLFFLFPNYPAI